MPSRSHRFVTLLALLVLCGACGHSSESPGTGSPTPVPPAAAIWYTAVGASDAAGVGSSLPCIPFTDCPGGMGYVPRVARQLRTDGHNVTLTNMGIPGAVLSPATQQLGNQYGLGIQANFMEEEGPFVPKDTTLVTIFAGGNDANTIGTAIDRGAATPAEADAYIDRQVASFASDYASLLAMVRGRANNRGDCRLMERNTGANGNHERSEPDSCGHTTAPLDGEPERAAGWRPRRARCP